MWKWNIHQHRLNKKGVSEKFKEHAWKVCIPQNHIEGSNPCPSTQQQNKLGLKHSLKKIYKIKFKTQKMKKLFFLFVSALLLSSCSTPSEETTPVEETVVDSAAVGTDSTAVVDTTVAQ